VSRIEFLNVKAGGVYTSTYISALKVDYEGIKAHAAKRKA
jgi:hypothetical protein